jgi:transposase
MTWLHMIGRGAELPAEDAIIFREFLALLEYKLGRRTDLDAQIEALALTPAFAAPVGWLRCFRGIQTHSAMVLATELVDWRRFETPRQLMAYLGFVPREHSSGDRERRGSITKAGNSHCRHVLIQAAWSYRRPPQIGLPLATRQRGQPAAVVAHAWKAQHRLHKRYQKLAAIKPPQVAAVAVARELIGFLWSVMRECESATA